LGHIISEKGKVVDPEKIKSIEGWPTPRNVSEVRSLMGLVGYYKIFIEGFSTISHPITSLQKKGVKFEWTSDCEIIFQHLKYLFTSALILRIFYPNEDFIVCTNACKEGLGGDLSQNGHVVCHESKKLKEHERHYWPLTKFWDFLGHVDPFWDFDNLLKEEHKTKQRSRVLDPLLGLFLGCWEYVMGKGC
jgi:hypothetical protein